MLRVHNIKMSQPVLGFFYYYFFYFIVDLIVKIYYSVLLLKLVVSTRGRSHLEVAVIVRGELDKNGKF